MTISAHAMLHSREVENDDLLAPAKDRNTKEVEAESIAYTVCQHFGIDTSDYSFGYVAGWSRGRETVHADSYPVPPYFVSSTRSR